MQNDIVRPPMPSAPQMPDHKKPKTETSAATALPRVADAGIPQKEQGRQDRIAAKTAAGRAALVAVPAATEDQTAEENAADRPAATTKQRRSLETWLKSLSKKQQIALGGAVVLVFAGLGAGWTLTHHRRAVIAAAPIIKAAKPKPAPAPIVSTLTGLPITDPSLNQKPVTGVMIENSQGARPQSGLNQAGIVFEAIAEGGITRFLALYQDSAPDYLGPVRSARPYYLQWCQGFDCAIAHVGGSPEALQDIKTWGMKDLDQFGAGGSYDRISSRYAPHNVYTSMGRLNQLEASRGDGAAAYTSLSRKKDSPAKTPTAKTINVSFGSSYYNVHYDYDPAVSSYKRSEGGTPHMELNKDGTQTQITPKVVVAMVMQYGLEADDHHSQYNVIGSGQAFVFQDGTVTTGTWNKADAASQIELKDANGQPIKLNAGQTWFTAVSNAKNISYNP